MSARDLQAQELTVSDSGASCPNLLIPPFLAESEGARLYEDSAAKPSPLTGGEAHRRPSPRKESVWPTPESGSLSLT